MFALAHNGVVIFLCCCLAGNLINSQPIGDTSTTVGNEDGDSLWKGTPMDAVVRQFREECQQSPSQDSGACIKMKALNLLDQVLSADSFKVADGVSVIPNENETKEKFAGRQADTGFLDQLENYIKRHDIVVKPPNGFLQGATFKMSPRNLDENELIMSVKLSDDEEGKAATFEDRGRKSKLRKILVPILVFVLLKAMTLIPLAIGVLGLKAWNALQLSFISFLVSISLAIFQLCKKVAIDSGSPIAAHIPFETSHYAAARNFIVDTRTTANGASSVPVENYADNRVDEDAQNMAYRGYVKQS